MLPKSRTNLALLALPLLLFACASPRRDNGTTRVNSQRDTDVSAKRLPSQNSPKAASTFTPKRGVAPVPIGASVQGTPIVYSILGSGPDTTFLLAAIHGDEDAGAPLLEMFITHLQANPELLAGKRVIILPIANPDGRKARKRGNANGIDLNRNFDSKNFSSGSRHGTVPLSEPESRAILELLELYEPARVISIHQPLQVIDFDGPGAELAERVSRASGLPVQQLGSRPGSLGSYVGVDLGIPILTVELPRGAERLADSELWTRYSGLVLAAIAD